MQASLRNRFDTGSHTRFPWWIGQFDAILDRKSKLEPSEVLSMLEKARREVAHFVACMPPAED